MNPTGSTAGPWSGGPLGVCAHADSVSTHTARSTLFVLRIASVRITSVGKFLTLSRRANFPWFAGTGVRGPDATLPGTFNLTGNFSLFPPQSCQFALHA